MLRVGAVTVTRRKSYDRVKYYLANQVLIFNERRVPAVRHLAEDLDINKSSVSRALIQLCEDDKFIEKVNKGSSRNSYYNIIADFEQCQQYKNYYLLPRRKKVKFLKMCKDARQNSKERHNEGWYFGSKMWTKFLAEYQSKIDGRGA